VKQYIVRLHCGSRELVVDANKVIWDRVDGRLEFFKDDEQPVAEFASTSVDGWWLKESVRDRTDLA
jgi:hypothetical protein